MNETLLNKARLNVVSLNKALINGAFERHGSSAGGGGEVIPPEEPDVPDVPVTYILSASASNGVVSASVNGKAVTLPYTANEGDVVAVEVTANDGYEFEGWSDGSTDNPRSITMTADVTLSATCVVKAVEKEYIQFEDPAVLAICVANWDTNGSGYMSKNECEAVTSIGSKFRENAEITSFDELRYFVNVATLDSYSFYKCSALISIGLDNIKTLKDYALHSTGLSGEIELNSVESYGRNVMGGTSVTSIILPSVVQIGEGAFDGLSTLKVVDIGENCTSIGNTAWRSDSALLSIVVRASTPPCLGSNAFQWTNNTFIIYVPDAAVDTYKAASGWSDSSIVDRIKPLSQYNG